MMYRSPYFALVASLLAAQVCAQTPVDLAAAQARYQRETAACLENPPSVDKPSCMTDARNALAEIKRGRMNESSRAADFENNALQRCEAHLGEDRSDCIARMQGRGSSAGSVAGGGILRELTTRTTVVSPVVQPVLAKDPEEPLPSGLMSNCRWVPPSDWVCK